MTTGAQADGAPAASSVAATGDKRAATSLSAGGSKEKTGTALLKPKKYKKGGSSAPILLS